jgi:hypothetical protein
MKDGYMEERKHQISGRISHLHGYISRESIISDIT